MERISFSIERQDIADALHAHAVAHGRSVEAELSALVETAYTPVRQRMPNIQRLIELGRGLEFEPPPRQTFEIDAPDL